MALSACEWRSVHREDHGESRLVDAERFKRRGICKIGDAFADLNSFHTCDCDDIARRNFFGFVAFEAAERK